MRSVRLAAEEGRLAPELLFDRLAAARGLVLAVSGGVDSTALMVLVAGWRGRPPTLVVTVDHRLRPEAAQEAALVAANADRLGLPCRIMRAPVWDGAGNLQDWARRARYDCLSSATREAGFEVIVTAHHREDQAETFLMRLARGSGIYGLAGMAEETELPGVRLVRPLLQVSRAELAEVAAASGLEVANDPSNTDGRFDRVRMRELGPALAARRLTPQRLTETAARLARAAAAIDHYVAKLLVENFRAGPHGTIAGHAAALAEAPEEVSLRTLARIVAAVGGAEYTPRLDSIESLHGTVVSGSMAGRWKRTLGGAVISMADGRLSFRREWGRGGPPVIPARAGESLVWDRRFRVHVPDIPGDLRVAPLGLAQLTQRLVAGATAEYRGAWRTAPGLFRGDELVATAGGDEIVWERPLFALSAECLVGTRLGLAGAPSEGPN